jgi:hypothetical protein
MTELRTATHAAAGRARGTSRSRSSGSRRTARRPPARRRAPGARRSSGSSGVSGIARWWPALLILGALLAGGAYGTVQQPPAPAGTCTVPDGSVTVTAEQATNAATIARVARDRGLPDRAVVIALATAQQESRLRNLDYGDRDSLGLFQQRPSQGWGTPEQVQDPVYAAGKFYDHLVEVPQWETGDLTTVADAVQRSAFPLAYRQWTGFAESLTAALPASGEFLLTCTGADA